MEIKGEVQDIIYQNEVNSYTIAVFDTDEEETTIVGYLPFVQKGDMLKLEGMFVEHKDYGRQFKVNTFEKIMPETAVAIEKFLANGNIKGVGPATAKRIVEKFGENTINILKNEYDRLANVKGITLAKAKEKELLKENLANIRNKESGDKKKVENIQNENNALKQTNKELREQLDSILYSRSYKILQKVKKIIKR